MKVLILHNNYGRFSGEERVVENQINILKQNGNTVLTYFRDSSEIEVSIFGQINAFFSGFFNIKSLNEVNKILKHENPDLVHIHNLYPFISPFILYIIKRRGFPIVMTVHNYRLICPNGLFYTKNAICERCTSFGKEINCIIHNCENSIFKSIGYSLRNWIARIMKFYTNNVDVFICLSEFQKLKLTKNKIPKSKCIVLPHMIVPKEYNVNFQGDYVAFLGRLSFEKGFDLLLKAAKRTPNIKYRIAGVGDSILKKYETPKNVNFVGFLSDKKLMDFISNSKFLVFPSRCYETFGLSILEVAMAQKPTIASNLAGTPEIIDDNYNGILFKSEDIHDLIEKITELWNNPKKVSILGENAFNKAITAYSPFKHYSQLNKIYSVLINK